eukprot:2739073-Amphidinium_carterae.1
METQRVAIECMGTLLRTARHEPRYKLAHDPMSLEQRLNVQGNAGNALADLLAKRGTLEHIRGGNIRVNSYHDMLRLHTGSGAMKDKVSDHPPLKRTEAHTQAAMQQGVGHSRED